MTRILPKKDVVIIGLGWTGSILAHELTDEGLDVVAIERGPWRDTATDFNIGYAQDEWKIRPNVTLNYGMRYEYYSPLKEQNNKVLWFDVPTGTLVPIVSAIACNSASSNWG